MNHAIISGGPKQVGSSTLVGEKGGIAGAGDLRVRAALHPRLGIHDRAKKVGTALSQTVGTLQRLVAAHIVQHQLGVVLAHHVVARCGHLRFVRRIQ